MAVFKEALLKTPAKGEYRERVRVLKRLATSPLLDHVSAALSVDIGRIRSKLAWRVEQLEQRLREGAY